MVVKMVVPVFGNLLVVAGIFLSSASRIAGLLLHYTKYECGGSDLSQAFLGQPISLFKIAKKILYATI